ncbi:P-II family nitrogen regulator [Stieleria varia]|uniref:Nitrogen regulatory protein P-II n=1 Tax=Stieleria varia TaxID=2528005 RepID=A0A5C6AH50_9BACT|nr:P-II family nitrogen regulator [Stieleria varia]TWT98505.1 Nitrogen regulatory protein P-II [Stieleria varia]
MRMIIAIIQPTKLSTVRDALREMDVHSFSVCDAIGYGRQRGQIASFRGNEYRVELLRKIELEILVRDELLEPTIETIRRHALTGSAGQIGDGKIFVLPVADAIDMEAGYAGAVEDDI